jgi:hypothetical protein
MSKVRLLSLGLVLIGALALAAGCPSKPPANSRHPAAQGAAVATPAPPAAGQAIVIPDDVRAALPFDPSFTPLEFSDSGGEVRLKALSAWDTQRTSEWLLAEMEHRGYTSEDNPSQILQGLAFTNAQAKYTSVMVKATLHGTGDSEQCTVEITAK